MTLAPIPTTKLISYIFAFVLMISGVAMLIINLTNSSAIDIKINMIGAEINSSVIGIIVTFFGVAIAIITVIAKHKTETKYTKK